MTCCNHKPNSFKSGEVSQFSDESEMGKPEIILCCYSEF